MSLKNIVSQHFSGGLIFYLTLDLSFDRLVKSTSELITATAVMYILGSYPSYFLF